MKKRESLCLILFGLLWVNCAAENAPRIIQSGFGSGIKARELVDPKEEFNISDEKICFWTNISGATSEVRHVWIHKEVITDDLPLKADGERYRTWSCKENILPGRWTVKVYAGGKEPISANEMEVLKNPRVKVAAVTVVSRPPQKPEDKCTTGASEIKAGNFNFKVYHHCQNLLGDPETTPGKLDMLLSEAATGQFELKQLLIANITGYDGAVLWAREPGRDFGMVRPLGCGAPRMNYYRFIDGMIPAIGAEAEKINIRFKVLSSECARDAKDIPVLKVGESVWHVFGSSFRIRKVSAVNGILTLELISLFPVYTAGEEIDPKWFRFYLIRRSGELVRDSGTTLSYYSGDGTVHVSFKQFDANLAQNGLRISYEWEKNLPPAEFEVKNIPNPWRK